MPSPPPPPPGETPAGERFRKNFHPVFMRLKQPEVPGIWGSWDPATGPQRDSGSADWPDYDRTLVKAGEGLDADSVAKAQEQAKPQAAVATTNKGQGDPDTNMNRPGQAQEDTSVRSEVAANDQSGCKQDSSALAALYGIDVNGSQQPEGKMRDSFKAGPSWFPFGLWNRGDA